MNLEHRMKVTCKNLKGQNDKFKEDIKNMSKYADELVWRLSVLLTQSGMKKKRTSTFLCV
jgi:hypothetical protein